MLGATKKIVGADAGVRIFSVVTKRIRSVNTWCEYSSAVTKKTGGAGAGVRVFQCCDEEDGMCGCWGANIPIL